MRVPGLHLLIVICLSCLLALRNNDLKGCDPSIKEHNLSVIPLVEAQTDRAFALHKQLYSLLWLKRRIANGSEKYLRGIPEVSFFFDPHYYKTTVEQFWIDERGHEKALNLTISVLKITPQVVNLRQQDQEPFTPPSKAADHMVHHYFYYLQSMYHYDPPGSGPKGTVQDCDYILDAVYVEIYPVAVEPDKQNREAA